MNYDEARFELFSKTFVGKSLLQVIRKKRKIPKSLSATKWLLILKERQSKNLLELGQQKGGHYNDSTQIPLDFVWAYKDILTEFEIPEVKLLANKLSFSQASLTRWILYDVVKGYPYRSYISVSPSRPITQTGYYIQVYPDSSLNEIKEIYKDAHRIAVISDQVDKHIDTNNIKTSKRGFVRDSVIEKDHIRFKVVIIIENEMIKIFDENDFATDDLAREGGIVTQAIERCAGDLLSDIENDSEFEEDHRAFCTRMRTVYYAMLRKYKLPKYTDLNRLLDYLNS